MLRVALVLTLLERLTDGELLLERLTDGLLPRVAAVLTLLVVLVVPVVRTAVPAVVLRVAVPAARTFVLP